jgi:predicted DNA-binding helix-hairpin-helix protein
MVSAFVLMFALALSAGGMQPQPIDINSASVEELIKVPGMTASWAGRIVRFRPYRTKLDLVEFGVVTPDVYNHIRSGVIAHHTRAAQPVAPIQGKSELKRNSR